MNENLHSATHRLARSWLLLWLIVLLAFALRIYKLGSDSLWYDEAYSATLVRADIATAMQMAAADLNPPLHALFLRGGGIVFGTSEFALRFVSLVPGMLLIPLIWVLARRLFDRPTAHLAALLVCLSPLLVWYAREARMYSQVTALGLAATYMLVRANVQGQTRWWVAFVACALGAVYSHYLALYLVAALGVFWITTNYRPQNGRLVTWFGRQTLRPAAVAFGVMAFGIAATMPRLLALSLSSKIYWPAQLDVAIAITGAVRALVGGPQFVALPTVTDALAALCGATALAAMLSAVVRPSIRRGAWLVLVVTLVALALMLAVIYQRPKFEPRYMIILAPAVWLLVAAGVHALWRGSGPVMRTAAVLAVLALASGSIVLDMSMFSGAAARDDWRGAVAYIRQNIQPDEALVLVSGPTFPALAYYDAPPWVALPDDPVLDVTHVLDYQSVAPVLNRIQAERHGVWLILSTAEIVDPTQIVPALLADIGTELEVPAQFKGLRLRHFALKSPAVPLPAEPPMAHRLDQSPILGLTAIGFTIAPQPLPDDAPLSVRMYWRADAPAHGAASGSLRIEDEHGQEWARRDGLLGGSFLSERWPLGQAVMGNYTITLPAGTPPGVYSLYQIVYRDDPASATGVLNLGDVVVDRPLRAPSSEALNVDPAGLARFGDLTLLSASPDQDTIKPCQPLYFTLFWRAERQPSDDYTLRVAFAGQATDQLLASGLPTSQWQKGDVWRTRHHIDVPCRAPDGPEELQLTLMRSAGRPVAAPLSVGTVNIQANRVFTPPAIQHSFQAKLGGEIQLLGYDLQRDRVQAGQSLPLTLYWQATREMTTSLTVFTHVEGEQRRVWGQHDGLPGSSLKPTDTWMVGEVIADRHVLTFDPATPPGKYSLVVGMYDLTSLERLPAFDEKGQHWLDDGIVLQNIVVTAH